MKILAFSSICYDYFPETGIAVPGGNSLNFAVQVKRFPEAEVSLAGFIGTDKVADEVLQLCQEKEIDTRFLVQLKGETASNKLYLTPEGERYSKPGEWQNGVKDDGVFTEDAWEFILSHDVVATICIDEYLDEFIRRKTMKNFLSVDFMHFDDIDLINRYLPFVDIAFFSPEKKMLDLLKQLAAKTNIPIVAMLGAEGSRFFQNGKEFIQPAFKVDKVIDTTGCGDAYQAAFCYAIIQSASIQDAMYLATKTATEVLKGYGGIFY